MGRCRWRLEAFQVCKKWLTWNAKRPLVTFSVTVRVKNADLARKRARPVTEMAWTCNAKGLDLGRKMPITAMQCLLVHRVDGKSGSGEGAGVNAEGESRGLAVLVRRVDGKSGSGVGAGVNAKGESRGLAVLGVALTGNRALARVQVSTRQGRALLGPTAHPAKATPTRSPPRGA